MSIESIIFYSFWNCLRKQIFAIVLVFFQDYPYFQIVSQIVCSAIMMAYLLRYLPFTRFVYNFSKLANEFTMILIFCHLLLLTEKPMNIVFTLYQ